MPGVDRFMAFTLFFWTRQEKVGEGREQFMLDLMGHCSTEGCSGKLHALVAVGYREGEKYFLKHPSALGQGEEFPFPASVTCTNCGLAMTLPAEGVKIISEAAEIFVKGLKAVRQAAKARWN